MIRILIAENIPCLNKGEQTILEGMLESFSILGDTQITMLSDNPELDSKHYLSRVSIRPMNDLWLIKSRINNNLLGKTIISSYIITKYAVFLLLYKFIGSMTFKIMSDPLWPSFAKSDIIIIGHNGTFGIGGGVGVPIMFYLLMIPSFARRIDKLVVLYAGSIPKAPKNNIFLKRAFKFSLEKMHLITVRERISLKNFEELNIKQNKAILTSDLAFLLKPSSIERIKKIMNTEGLIEQSRPLIGMTITKSIASKAFPLLDREESYIRHIDMMAMFIDRAIDELGATFVFVPHCIGLGEDLDDRISASIITKKCKNKGSIKLILNEYDAMELKGLIGQFDLFLGERAHSVINAIAMGIPSIFITPRDDKRQDILGMMDLSEFVYHVENLDTDDLFNKVKAMLNSRNNINKRLLHQAHLMTERAKENGILLRNLVISKGIVSMQNNP